MSSEKDNLLKFNQHINSDKMPNITYADLESLIKKQMDVEAIQKNLQQQNQVNIFFADVQCQLYGLLIIQKISIPFTVEKIIFLRAHATNAINF